MHITPTTIAEFDASQATMTLREWRGGRSLEVVVHMGNQGSWIPMGIARCAKKQVQASRDGYARILERETANVRELGGDA